MRTTHCITCNKELINRRPQTRTCGDACRAKAWRHAHTTKLPVAFMLSIANYALVKNAANAAGTSINEYAHDQLVQTVEAKQW